MNTIEQYSVTKDSLSSSDHERIIKPQEVLWVAWLVFAVNFLLVVGIYIAVPQFNAIYAQFGATLSHMTKWVVDNYNYAGLLLLPSVVVAGTSIINSKNRLKLLWVGMASLVLILLVCLVFLYALQLPAIRVDLP